MKTSVIDFGLVVLLIACLANMIVSTGCVTTPADTQSSFKLEGLERAAGPQYDTPVIY